MEDENESLNLQLAKMSSAKSPRHFKVRVLGVSGGFSHDRRGGGATYLTPAPRFLSSFDMEMCYQNQVFQQNETKPGSATHLFFV